MALVINTNTSSMTTQYYLNKSQKSLSDAMTQLSSGLRINSAADDAAGYAISSRMTAQVNGLTVAEQNSNNAVSLTQTAEGSLTQITNNLQRIRELAVESANATNSASDRTALQTEAAQLISEISREASSSQFNGVNLLDGSFTAQQFQVGANAGQSISVGTASGFIDARASALGQTYSSTVTSNTANSTTGVAYNATTNLPALAAGALVINGTSIGGTATDGVSYDGASGSAIAIANAINSSGLAGLTATANAATVTAGAAVTAASTTLAAGDLTINGQAITGTYTDATSLQTLINNSTASTGVTASVVAGAIKLTGVDGRNITVQSGAGSAATTGFTNSTAQTYTGTVSLKEISGTQSASNIAITGSSATGAFGTNVSATGTVQNTTLTALDVSTVAGANSALYAIDSALNAVNSASASLGAVQNRFESVVSSLEQTNQDLSSALSTIQDADYGAQTTAYSRANVLQSAGESMLSQANSNTQNVLKLLQNL